MTAQKHKNIARPAFLAIDFFCGAGGTTRGLIDAGGYVIAGIDKDNAYRNTYVQNNKNTYPDEEDIQFLNYDIFPRTKEYPEGKQKELFNEIERLISQYKNKFNEKIPLFFAVCAPCQPFTSLSKRKMTDKIQNKRHKDTGLLREACKFIRKFQPDIVLSENVHGITTEKFGGIWDGFQKNLQNIGYKTASKIVCASKFGVPQYRKRSIILALKKNTVKGEIYIPENNPNTSIVTAKDAIGHLPPIKAGEKHKSLPNHAARNLNEINRKRIEIAKPGESNKYMENTKYGDLRLPCHKRAKEKYNMSCFSDVYTRMRPDKPAPTITTKCFSVSNGRYGHYDTKQIRAISLREAALLQSFPENYVFEEKQSLETLGRMIGNAVPPKLAQFYAKYLTDQFLKSTQSVNQS